MITIKVFGTTWTIKYAHSFGNALYETNNEILAGKTNGNTREIILSNQLIPERLFETVRHELTHAVINTMLMNKNNFTQEEVCEFQEMYGAYISDLAKQVMTELNNLNGPCLV